MVKLWCRLKLWYINNFVPHIVLCSLTEHCYISKALWKRIVRNLPDPKPKELNVFFEKYPITSYVGNSCKSTYIFRFFINADLTAVKTPDGETPFTAPIQVSYFGHVGFQSVQPTPIEILTEYGIADQHFVNYNLADHVRLRVQESSLNGEPCYNILPVKIGENFRPNGEEEPDPKDVIDLTDVDDDE